MTSQQPGPSAMKVAFSVALVIVAVCAVDAKKRRDVCPVIEGCIPLPPQKCLLSTEDFRRYVQSGQTGNYKILNSVYQYRGFGKNDLDFQVRNQYLYTLTDSGTLGLYGKYRQGDVADPSPCPTLSEPSYGQLVGRRKAVFDAGILETRGKEDVTGRLFLMSARPDNYLITLQCLDASDIDKKGKFCGGRYLVDVSFFGNDERPDDLDWLSIERTLRKCLGLKLSDPKSHFLLYGFKCFSGGPVLPAITEEALDIRNVASDDEIRNLIAAGQHIKGGLFKTK